MLPPEADLANHASPFINSKKTWKLFRLPVALLLLLTAISKTVNAVSITESDGLLSVTLLLLTAILVETFVAIYLIVGSPVYSWRASIILFCTFVGALGYALATGRSCNCISQAISTRSMLCIDILVLVGLYYCRPAYKKSKSNTRAEARRAAIAVLVSFLVASVGAYQLQNTDMADPFEFLLADKLLGKRWPLDSRLDPSLRVLESGRWLILVVRQDCDHCRELVSKYFVDPHKTRSNERTAVFIAGENVWPFQFDNVSFDVDGFHSVSWPYNEPFVASPAVFVIRNAIVQEASDGNEADRLLKDIFLK